MSEWALVAIKRRWVPAWLFSLVTNAARLLETDLAECPRWRRLLLTEDFHYHDLGRAVYGTKCRGCGPKQPVKEGR